MKAVSVLKLWAFVLPCFLMIAAQTAKAQIVITFDGTPGAGTLTATFSGSSITTGTTNSANVISKGSTPDFISDDGVTKLANNFTGGCQLDGGPTDDFAFGAVKDDGPGTADNISVNLTSGIDPPIGTTIACTGSMTFPLDINDINLASPVTFTEDRRGLSITLATVALNAGTGATLSETLATQQDGISRVVVNFQSNTLGDNIFDHLDNIFGGGDSGPVITPTGFSASTRGVAKWISEKQNQKLASQLADMPAHEDGTKVAITPVAALMPVQTPKWNAWIKGNYRFYDGDGSSFDGHTIDVLAGLDYRVADAVVMGLVGGYGITDFNTLTGGTSGAFKADGYTAGAYMGIRLGANAQFDTLAAYTYSDYENRVGAVSGDFTAHRVTVGARLKGTWESEGGVFFEPGVRILYAEEWQGAYTDSAGVRQSTLTVTAGRVSVGPKVGYVHRSEDSATVKTWIAAYGEYDFSNQGNTPTSGLPDFDDILSGRVSAGVSAHSPGGVGLSLEGDIGGLGSGEYTSYGGTARIDLPL